MSSKSKPVTDGSAGLARPPRPESSHLAALLDRPRDEQRQLGYLDTLREITQQPHTWRRTAEDVVAHGPLLEARLDAAGIRTGFGSVLLSGSGSSLYVGECLAYGLQAVLGVDVRAVPGGDVLSHARGVIPRHGNLFVSFARSGESPESVAVVDLLLRDFPQTQHLIVTTNAEGALATRYRDAAAVTSIVLDERTCDRSLVMTSSFTNLLLAGRGLGWLGRPRAYLDRAEVLARVGDTLLQQHADPLREAARGITSAVFLGSGPRFGAARESALKLVEMTAGAVRTIAESYLGVRHGPLTAIGGDTLVVCFLGADEVVRAYELDLLRELDRKRLGARKIVVGESVPPDVLRVGDLLVECAGMNMLGEDDLPVVDVLVGQLLGFFRCLELGFAPDAPSPQGVISRVVEEFRIH